MLVPLKWLREYIVLEETPAQLVQLINSRILEVEALHHPGKEIKEVIVAEILEVNKHPNADKLHVLKVNTGKEILQVVCGAQNVAPKMKIALAQVGAVLPGGFEIKNARIRDVESFGMCCSEKELGLTAESAGIMKLAEDAPVGKDFVKYMGMDDVIFDLAILPNRGDCQSLRSIAIELHAATGGRLTFPLIKKGIRQGTERKTDITIENTNLCGRYMSCIIEVKIKPSPVWMQNHLKSVGLRPINNVVDITNFILYEMGQPLHAFDYAKLSGGKIVVRTARKGEQFVSLENKNIELNEDMLVIADAEKPVALAGIMGSVNSCVDEKTTTLLLESAFFNPASIRKTSRAANIRTDSSVRFEKYVSYDGVEEGFFRCLNLLTDHAEARVVSNLTDLDKARPKPLIINFSPEKVNQILGAKIHETKMQTILKRLQFKLDHVGTKIKVTVPTGRIHDIYREIDLVEEIARHIGYESIPSTLPGLSVLKQETPKKQKVEIIVREVLRAGGLTEALSYSMTSPKIYTDLGLEQQFHDEVKLSNPLSEDESVLRQSLIPQLIKALLHNNAQQIQNVGLFEIGKVYSNKEERVKIAAIVSGTISEGELDKSKRQTADIYYLKGILENILERLNINYKKILPGKNPFVHPGKSLELKPLLFMGELSPLISNKLGLLKPVYIFEMDLDQLALQANFKKKFSELPIYPSSRRDIAFLINKNIQSAEVERVIRSAAEEIVETVEVFDQYSGENIPEGKVSLAYAITYRAKDKTLKDEEINAAHEKIKKALVLEMGIEFR